MSNLVSRSWWCGVAVVGLMACGGAAPSTYRGTWKGSGTQQQVFWVPGVAGPMPQAPVGYPTMSWVISTDAETCGEWLTVTVFDGCNVRAAPSGSAYAFTPGFWCEKANKQGGTARYTVLGGTLEARDMRVDGKVAKVLSGAVQFSIQNTGPKTSGVYVEFTNTIADALMVGDSTSGRNRCNQLNDAPWEPEDWATEAKCDAIIDRSAEAADRTVAITGKTFTPACMRIATGQSVSFTGAWAVRYGLSANDATTSAEGNPIPIVSGADPTIVSFPRPGDYTYYSSDMTGMIRVR